MQIKKIVSSLDTYAEMYSASHTSDNRYCKIMYVHYRANEKQKNVNDAKK